MNAAEQFAKLVLDKTKDRVANGSMDEGDDERMELALRCGYGDVRKVVYDPIIHGEVDDCEPGDIIWFWKPILPDVSGHVPAQRKEPCVEKK